MTYQHWSRDAEALESEISLLQVGEDRSPEPHPVVRFEEEAVPHDVLVKRLIPWPHAHLRSRRWTQVDKRPGVSARSDSEADDRSAQTEAHRADGRWSGAALLRCKPEHGKKVTGVRVQRRAGVVSTAAPDTSAVVRESEIPRAGDPVCERWKQAALILVASKPVDEHD